jgi:molybdopterin/thiamine biosynthesis adenylyltransferase
MWMLIAERTRQFIKNQKIVSLKDAKKQFLASRKQLGHNEHSCSKKRKNEIPGMGVSG